MFTPRRLATLAAACLVIHAQAAAGGWSDIYVFGDSLSDTGNLWSDVGGAFPPSPPYFNGRFSDGPVWVEYLALNLGLPIEPDINYAYGGSTSGNRNVHDPDGARGGLPGLLTQVSRCLMDTPALDPNAIYTVWTGGNDYLSGVPDHAAAIDETADNIEAAVTSLAGAGARTFIVPNLMDLGKLPRFLGGPDEADRTALSDGHNAALAARIPALATMLGVTIVQPDIEQLYDDIISNPAGFGLSVTNAECLDTMTGPCANPGEYMFFDEIHPTTVTHGFIAQRAQALLPTPAAATAGWVLY